MQRCLIIEAEEAAGRFPHRPFRVAHRLADSPLFELSRLVELGRSLAPDRVEYNLGELDVHQDPASVPGNGLSVEETIERIGQCRSWLVLKNVEQDPDYRALLEGCMAEFRAWAGQTLGRMADMMAFIFVTSPGSVTPFHFDPELNFLLQIRGDKIMHAFDEADRELLPETRLEQQYVDPSTHRNLTFEPHYQARAESFHLQPGQGVYMPVHAPHWVQNGDQVSVSFSITCRSAQSQRRARLYGLNGRLRRAGLRPVPVGASPWRDAVKDTAYRAYCKARRLAGGGD